MGNSWVESSNCSLADAGQFHDRFLDNSLFRGGEPGFYPVDFTGSLTCLDFVTSKHLFNAVERCAPLASIINKLSNYYAAGKGEVLNRATQNYVRGQYKEWERLMDKPNKFQTKSQFRKMLYAFTKINGWCYVMPKYPIGFKDRPNSLVILPPWMMEVQPIYNSTFPINEDQPVREIYFNWAGSRIKLKESELILFTDNGTDVTEYTFLPVSRLKSLAMPISNIVADMEARNSLMTKRGALGFISNENKDGIGGTLPMGREEKKEIEKEFTISYGMLRRQSLVAIVQQAVKWQQTAMSTKDLMLLEEHADDVGQLCDGLGFPYYLMSNGKGSTFSNVGEAEKSVYQNTIMPDAVQIDECLNEGLRTPDNNIELKTDYSHIEALQKSETERATAKKLLNESCQIQWTNGLITLNEWREMLGDDTIDGEQYDMYKPEYDAYKVDNGLDQTVNMQLMQNDQNNGNADNQNKK